MWRGRKREREGVIVMPVVIFISKMIFDKDAFMRKGLERE